MTSTQEHIRQAVRSKRKQLSHEEKQKQSQAVADTLRTLPAYQNATNVGVYLHLPEELSVEAITSHAWSQGKSVYLPVVLQRGAALAFAPYHEDSRMRKDCLSIPIPDVSTKDYIHAEQLDCVITPLVAFDQDCNRIGMGGGFYDRTFATKTHQPFLIGVAFIEQLVADGITANAWDVRPDCIVTADHVYTSPVEATWG